MTKHFSDYQESLLLNVLNMYNNPVGVNYPDFSLCDEENSAGFIN